MKRTIKKYILYLIRWQLSTPILGVVLILLASMDTLVATIIANLIGGLMFFWVDKFIFRKRSKLPQWEIKENYACADCAKTETCFRIVSWGKYDRSGDESPQYRCKECSLQKMSQIQH